MYYNVLIYYKRVHLCMLHQVLQYCDLRVYVCFFVCLSPCVCQKPHCQISPNFVYVLLVAVARSSSDGNAICYVLLVMFPYNGGNWSESKTMRTFKRIEFICAIQKTFMYVYVLSNSPGGGTGEVYRLRLHLGWACILIQCPSAFCMKLPLKLHTVLYLYRTDSV